ncbi:MAG: hypothetical protein KGH69_05025 [Candidatus Micrarchaeota archaeon]|nr:hypothetical protein [Candidatus Micrarchaeota archaeon]
MPTIESVKNSRILGTAKAFIEGTSLGSAIGTAVFGLAALARVSGHNVEDSLILGAVEGATVGSTYRTLLYNVRRRQA